MLAAGGPGREFEVFFDDHHRELSRLAYLLTSDHGAADDLAGDTLLAAWRQWSRIRDLDRPLAYVRRMMVNIAASRVRRLVRERHVSRLSAAESAGGGGPDPVAVVTVQWALRDLPHRRRVCVVLRHAFDLSEREVASILGVSVGTVKSQTSKGVAQLVAALGVPAPRTSVTSTGRVERRAGCES